MRWTFRTKRPSSEILTPEFWEAIATVRLHFGDEFRDEESFKYAWPYPDDVRKALRHLEIWQFMARYNGWFNKRQ